MLPSSNHKLPTWAPRVKQSAIRQLYENDAQGIYDEDLLNQVGWGLHARCDSFITAVEAARGRVACPECGTIIQRAMEMDEILHCPHCGWQHTWQAYFHTFQHKQLSGAEAVLELFQGYLDRFPAARTYAEKMLLIDGLIHGFHWYYKFGNTRTVAVNLIQGSYHQVVEFLDGLTYGPRSTSGLEQQWQDWREKIRQVEELWKKMGKKKA